MESINKRKGSLVEENLVYLLCVSLEHVLKIYSEREETWRISWTHQSFGKSEIMMKKVLEVQKP